MSRNFSRWIRSKTGVGTIIGALAVIVVAVIVGQLLGWWAALGELTSGTAAPPPGPHYPAPPGGYTCLPTCAENDGKFFSHVGEDMASFSGNTIVVWIGVPGDYGSFTLGIFDGDSVRGGNWDNTNTETTYALYADPVKDGKGTTVVGTWRGNTDGMPNNAWFEVTIDNVAEAQAPSGHFFYRLEATRALEDAGVNAFKLRSSGYLTTGKSNMEDDSLIVGMDDLVDANFAIVGMLYGINDARILYPEFTGDMSNLGPSTYSGEWQFYIHVPEETTALHIWDGDFDRGTTATDAADTDDPNTSGKPPWAGPFAVNERAGGRGAPPDDFPHHALRRNPPVEYVIVDPDGAPIYTNTEPSGTEEWERFVLSTDAGENPDVKVDEIKPGFYTMRITGLDLGNTVWIRTNYEVCPPDDCGPPVCDESCPRTIGYWKNNVKKVLIDGKTKGVQETQESIEAALRLIALESPLFRHGIDVQNPQPISDPTPLTAEEANLILQRDQKSYPGGKDQANSMLARALQQNLASWLNWGSGKVCDNAVVTLDVHGGYFEGTLWKALLEAQDIILNGGDLERAKDIGDQINNGLLGENAETSVCDDYKPVLPPDKQPPSHADKPKGPKKDDPPNPTPVPEPDPETCAGVRVNKYKVEITNNPFYGIKFEYTSGTEIKDGDYEEFRIVVTEDEAASMTSVQLEAKAGINVGTVTLEACDFTSVLPCGSEPVQDENGFFAFYFMGAEDNGDGTMTLAFYVQNMTSNGLSHATIGLPAGVIPSTPTDSYESKVCPEE